MAEKLAIERAKEVFGGDHVNVQPHAGAQTNSRRLPRAAGAGRHAPGHGALPRRPPHPRHAHQPVRPPVRRRRLPRARGRPPGRHGRGRARSPASTSRSSSSPAGRPTRASSTSRRFREIADEVGASLLVDMAHFAGLVAAGLHPNPVPYADVVTTTVHKTLGGARGGMIICREEHAKKINSAVFPGQQGGPLEHVIAGKAVALRIAADRGLPRAPGAHARRRQGGRRRAAGRRPRRQRAHRRHRRAPRAGRPARVRAQRPAGRGPAGRGRHHGQPQRGARSTRARRWSPAACAWAPPALATRGLQPEDFAEIGEIMATALAPGFEPARRSWPTASSHRRSLPALRAPCRRGSGLMPDA